MVVVDDGLATGGTARAAVAVARARGARRVVKAVPVAAPESLVALREDARCGGVSGRSPCVRRGGAVARGLHAHD
ncbi:MAG: hypothetical protein ACKOVH_08775 [Actinomycetota bacterium]